MQASKNTIITARKLGFAFLKPFVYTELPVLITH